MSLKRIISESLAQNPVGLKEALSEILSGKISIALEAKIEEVSEAASEGKQLSVAVSRAEASRQRSLKKAASMVKKGFSHEVAAQNHDVTVGELKRHLGESVDLSEGVMKDGYYVHSQSKLTHDQPFKDSKAAIRHADKGENKTGYVHRVTHVKGGKIEKQWEYNGGHHEGGWEHFSDHKGENPTDHIRGIPNHLIKESDQLDEISKSTLGSYVKKAYTDASKKSTSARNLFQRGDESPPGSLSALHAHDMGRNLSRKSRIRKDFADKAVNKLTKEDLSEAKNLRDYDWPESDLHPGNTLGDHAHNAIGHGMYARDALDHLHGAVGKEKSRKWLEDNREDLLKTFRSHGLK